LDTGYIGPVLFIGSR